MRAAEIRLETGGIGVKITAVRPVIVGDQRNFLFVLVETDEGITGIGEAGLTWREGSTAGYVGELTPLLIGQDPFRTEHLWQVMFRSGFFPAGRVGCAAISAIDIALWDIKAQALNVPLYELLGGLVRDRVVCYPHVVGDSSQQLAEDAQRYRSAGWQFARFNFREDPDGVTLDPAAAVRRSLEDVEAVRTAVGDDLAIIVDVHTRLDPADAIRYCRDVECWKPYFIEDPVRMENFETFRKLARHVNVPLAAGEQYASKWEFRQQIEEDLIDYCRIDVCIAGGITESLKVRDWCQTHYIRMAPHNPLGPVATAACLHLDLATDHFAVQELARLPGEVLPELFPVQVPFEAGWLTPPRASGLGITIDESAVERYPPVSGGGCPRLQRSDGSFTNW